MDKEKLGTMMQELFYKIENQIKSILEESLNDMDNNIEIRKALLTVTESMEAVRLALKYIVFDLEATRRERDELRMILEDRND